MPLKLIASQRSENGVLVDSNGFTYVRHDTTKNKGNIRWVCQNKKNKFKCTASLTTSGITVNDNIITPPGYHSCNPKSTYQIHMIQGKSIIKKNLSNTHSKTKLKVLHNSVVNEVCSQIKKEFTENKQQVDTLQLASSRLKY